MSDIQEAKKRLAAFTDAAQLSIDMVKAGGAEGALELGIILKKEDGSGTVACSFDCAGFMKDMELVFGDENESGTSERQGS